uniref:auxin-responsive protein IAA16-like n=1 Tax=Erigeron canadensis TaxID=72917 RepID=UPI001CB95384|nr:auxin-responsive protein IAA16-like [Erigeron canadensis]
MSSSISLKQQHDYLIISPSSSQKQEAKMGDKIETHNNNQDLKATELTLGLPGSSSSSNSAERNTTIFKNLLVSKGAKRGFFDTINNDNNSSKTWAFSQVVSSSPKHSLHDKLPQDSATASKEQVVGWPPIRSFRKNSMVAKHPKNEDDPKLEIGSHCAYVKVSMDGAPYLRKVDLNIYQCYSDLSSALEKMFSSFTLGQHGTNGVPRREGLGERPSMDLFTGSEYVLTYEDKDGDLMLVGDVPWDMFTGTCKRMRIMKSSDAIGLAPRGLEKCKRP